MTYNFDDNNFNKGTVNLYMNNELFATVRIKTTEDIQEALKDLLDQLSNVK